MLGYRPRGYAPFELSVYNVRDGREYHQTTENEVEHLGVTLVPGLNELTLVLRDALGREVVKPVRALRTKGMENFTAAVANARLSGYSDSLVAWTTSPGVEPPAQIPASDCDLGNGPLSCTGCPKPGGFALPNGGPGGGGITGGGNAPVLGNGVVLLYFFLVAASDRDGLSYYSDGRIGETIDLDTHSLRVARVRLEERSLVLYRQPIYQVLPIPSAGTTTRRRLPTPRETARGERLPEGRVTSLARPSPRDDREKHPTIAEPTQVQEILNEYLRRIRDGRHQES